MSRTNDQAWLCADNAAGWHASWLTALGLRWERTDAVWRALDRPPVIYWTAITLGSAASPSHLAGSLGTVCDAGACVDLTPAGFQVWTGERAEPSEPWYMRPARPLDEPPPMPDDLEIVTVDSDEVAEEFEGVTVRGFRDDEATVEPGSLHPSTVLADARATLLLGRAAGVGVSAAMSYRTDRSVGIYGVTTLRAARGRGYASALTRALIDPALPTTLSPSPAAESLYRRLGFEEAGRLRQWVRPARDDGAPGAEG
jgi:GNAT superfamily N-acetyltransferase